MSVRQAAADLARELLEEIDIVGAFGQPADGSSILWASGPTRMRHWSEEPWAALSPLQQCAHVRDRVGIAFQAVRILFGLQFNLQPDAVRIVEVEGLYREVRAFCAKGLTPEQRAHADFLRKIKPYVQAWYGTWHEAMLDQPFYRVNSRT